MLERDQDWTDLLFCIEEQRPVETVSRHFGIPVPHVLHYRDMHDGLPVLHAHGRIPERLREFAVGFRYRAVIRWVITNDIKRARSDYDVGAAEMATGPGFVRDEPAWILYSFPRKAPANRPLYFSA